MMKNAIEDCFNAGVGLTAMKTMAKGGWGTDSITPNEKEQKLFNLFKKKGFTVEQAKLKAVWGDHRIASICSHMTNMKNLSANVSAAIDSNILSDQDFDHLKKYAHETSSNYCTGCAYICESTLDYQVPVADVMRYLMYAHCYGEPDKAKLAFKKLPAKVRKLMAYMDYNEAEQRCPQKMQISRLMRKAIVELA
jgi:hypothetical protein